MDDCEFVEGQQYVYPSASSILVNCRITAGTGNWVTVNKVTAHGADSKQWTAQYSGGQRRQGAAYSSKISFQ